MIIKNKSTLKIFSLVLCMLFVFSIGRSSIQAGEPVLPAQPSEAQDEVINEAADFLDDMGMSDMADNVRSWLEDEKILIDVNLRANGATDRQGKIYLNDRFVTPLVEDDMSKFIQIAQLAQLLVHEKTHAHQAPEGGALSQGIELGDWIAGSDVHSECIGPSPLEVEAYYKQIRAYLLWAQTIRNQEIPQGLSAEDAEAAQLLEDQKVEWLLNQVEAWTLILKRHNFEKANRFEDVNYIYDQFEEIDQDTEKTEAEKIQEKLDILNELLEGILSEDSFYDRARNLYEAKRGDEETTIAVPAIPDSMETVLVEFPDSMGYLLFDGLPGDIDTGMSELFEVSVNNFMIPPKADPGYTIISPVYEVSWNSESAVPYQLSIMVEELNLPNAYIAAFSLRNTEVEKMWTPLETEINTDGETSVLMTRANTATMYAVIVPEEAYSDMPYEHWAYDSTSRLVDKEVLDDTDVLYPSMEVTRELFVKYLVTALGLELIEESVPFDDVDPTNPYFTYISTAYYNSLTSGVAADRFGIGEIIPREQSITFLVRAIGMEFDALGMKPTDMIGHIDSFFDIYTECSEWAHPYLAQAVKVFMLEGYPDGTLRGKNQLTHAEVIALIDRIMIHITYNGIAVSNGPS